LALTVCLALFACGKSAGHRRSSGPGSGAGGSASGSGGGGTGGTTAGGTGAGATGSGGSTRGGSAGLGGSAGAGDGGAGDGGRGGGAGDAGAGGEAEALPRVLVIDAATNRLEAYDRDGVRVRNFAGAVELGDEWSERTVAASYYQEPWDGQQGSPVAYLAGTTRGLVEPIAPSLVIIHGTGTGDAVKLRVYNLAGDLVAEHVIDGGWESFHESPKHGYLFAVRYAEDSSYPHAAVFRMSDASLVWQDHVTAAAFARDDSHFVFTPAELATPVGIVDLETGAVRVPPGDRLSSDGPPEIRAAVAGRAIVSGRASGQGRLWSIDWSGAVHAFGNDREYSDDTLESFDGTGTKAVWSRITNDLDPMPYTFVGSYAIDFEAGTAGAWDGPDYACFERPDAWFFDVVAGALVRCECSDGRCNELASLPDAPGWTPQVSWSSDRQVVLVRYEWQSARVPEGSPESRCFDAAGTPLTTAPNGSVALDATGRLLLVRTAFTAGNETFVIDVASGARHSLGQPLRSLIVYQ
jgi:hypothetical protein